MARTTEDKYHRTMCDGNLYLIHAVGWFKERVSRWDPEHEAMVTLTLRDDWECDVHFTRASRRFSSHGSTIESAMRNMDQYLAYHSMGMRLLANPDGGSVVATVTHPMTAGDLN